MQLESQRRAALLMSDQFAKHDLASHPENQGRLDAVYDLLRETGYLEDRLLPEVKPAALGDLERVHDLRYLENLQRFAAAGGGMLDADTYVGPDSFDVALLAAGAAVQAVDLVLGGACRAAFSLSRPPGHHATPQRGMGFCLVNHAGVAAARALHLGASRVAIIDWDVHHGNGTQEMFYDSDQVLYCSVHQFPFYPGTGAADERGVGAGVGLTLNVPLAAGHGDADYVHIFEGQFCPLIEQFQPDLLLVSAGYDAHRDDPLGGMAVSDEGFEALTVIVQELADKVANGRIVAILEGGYDPQALARSVCKTIDVLDAAATAKDGLEL